MKTPLTFYNFVKTPLAVDEVLTTALMPGRGLRWWSPPGRHVGHAAGVLPSVPSPADSEDATKAVSSCEAIGTYFSTHPGPHVSNATTANKVTKRRPTQTVLGLAGLWKGHSHADW